MAKLNPDMKIQSERIYLRPIQYPDIFKIMRWRNRPEVRKGFFSRKILTKEEQKKWFKQYLKDKTDMMFMITTKDNKDIGCVAIYRIDRNNKKAEVGRIIIGEKEFLRKGFAKEALEALSKYAFNRLNLQRLYCYILEGNKPSLLAFAGAGFDLEGILKRDIFLDHSFKNIIVMARFKR
jgi:RimJ/RimL family protein N-acetyltransferase